MVDAISKQSVGTQPQLPTPTIWYLDQGTDEMAALRKLPPHHLFHHLTESASCTVVVYLAKSWGGAVFLSSRGFC